MLIGQKHTYYKEKQWSIISRL